MQSAPQRVRLSASLADATAALSGCAAADTALPCFSSLPLPVVLHIFSLLPADARARAAAVCSSWYWQLTARPTAWELWTELDLSETSGVTCTRGNAALEGAAARARGRLRTLKLRDYDAVFQPHGFTFEAALRVVAANARLEELAYVCVNDDGADVFTSVEELQELLAAAPALQRLTADVDTSDTAVARALLRREPPYAALRLHDLCVGDDTAASPLRSAAGVIALAEDVAACKSLRVLNLWHANLEAPAALAALVDAALTRELFGISLTRCTFASAVALPQLARLLADDCNELTRLVITDSPTLFENVQEAHLLELFDALKQSFLEWLQLKNVGLPAGAHVYMTVLLRGALASRPEGSCDDAVVAVE